MFCVPKSGLIFVPAIAASTATSILETDPSVIFTEVTELSANLVSVTAPAFNKSPVLKSPEISPPTGAVVKVTSSAGFWSAPSRVASISLIAVCTFVAVSPDEVLSKLTVEASATASPSTSPCNSSSAACTLVAASEPTGVTGTAAAF